MMTTEDREDCKDNLTDMGEARVRLIPKLYDKISVHPTLESSRIGLLVVEESRPGSASLTACLSQTRSFACVLGSRTIEAARQIADRGRIHVAIINASIRDGNETAFDLVRSLAGLSHPVRSLMIKDSWQGREIIEAFGHGAKGLLTTRPINVERTSKAVACVQKGQIWADNEQLSHTLNYFAGIESSRRSAIPAAASLTRREKEIARLLCQGVSNKEIAESLYISERTVKNHLGNIFEKIGVRSRVQAALKLMGDGANIDHITAWKRRDVVM